MPSLVRIQCDLCPRFSDVPQEEVESFRETNSIDTLPDGRTRCGKCYLEGKEMGEVERLRLGYIQGWMNWMNSKLTAIDPPPRTRRKGR